MSHANTIFFRYSNQPCKDRHNKINKQIYQGVYSFYFLAILSTKIKKIEESEEKNVQTQKKSLCLHLKYIDTILYFIQII